MKKLVYLLIILSFVAGITIGSSHVSAQTSSIPSWVKKTALWWGQGQISDDDFVKAIQWMVDNGIIHVENGTSQPTPDQTQKSAGGIFSPCTEVDLKNPSSCLARYLPTPSELGQQWSTQNGPGIPSGVSSPVLTQLVREDFEDINAHPLAGDALTGHCLFGGGHIRRLHHLAHYLLVYCPHVTYDALCVPYAVYLHHHGSHHELGVVACTPDPSGHMHMKLVSLVL